MTPEEIEMGHLERVAYRKAGSVPGWKLCAWERVDASGKYDDFIVQGGVPRLLKTGKRKGQETWRDSNLTRVLVTGKEVEQEETDFVASTGKCARCLGKGEIFASWSAENGTKHRSCPDCSATGCAKSQP